MRNLDQQVFYKQKGAVRKWHTKWVILKTSQYSQENVCVGVFFKKLRKALKNSFFYGTPALAASV